MLKIKLFAVAAFLILTAIALSSSRPLTASANEDVFREIASYKTWQRINKEPIKVESGFQIDGVPRPGDTFIVDGEEVTNLRTGTLNG